jgi:N-acetylglucosaminyldiphosphoundecaprenol N-acetyl-beta-D-mannosaminyltransferase
MPVVAVGAAFDFWSGAVSEAPRILRGSGFEWVHRLAKEPRRLWPRYVIGNPRFLLMTWQHRR